MDKLVSYSIVSIDPNNQTITISFEFTRPEWNMTKKMFYGETSHGEFHEITEESGKKKTIEVIVKHPLFDITKEQDIKEKVVAYSQAYISGKLKEIEKVQKPPNHIIDLIGKQILV